MKLVDEKGVEIDLAKVYADPEAREDMRKAVTAEIDKELVKKLQMFNMYKQTCPKCSRPIIMCICRKTK